MLLAETDPTTWADVGFAFVMMIPLVLLLWGINRRD